MSGAAIIDNVARGWSQRPEASVVAETISAAVWTTPGYTAPIEVTAEPDPSRHIVAMPVRAFDGEMFLDGRRHWRRTVRPGSLTIVEAGREPRAVHYGAHAVLHVYLPASLLRDLVEREGLATRASSLELVDPGCREHDPQIARIADEVRRELCGGAPFARMRVETLGQELAIALLRKHSTLDPRRVASAASGGLAPWQTHLVQDYIETHLAEDVSLADLAALVGLSTFHLCRAFKRSTGVPPHRWHIARRVERARELLETTRLPTAEIASRVGYDDPGQFAAAFRKAFGLAPTSYRREREA